MTVGACRGDEEEGGGGAGGRRTGKVGGAGREGSNRRDAPGGPPSSFEGVRALTASPSDCAPQRQIVDPITDTRTWPMAAEAESAPPFCERTVQREARSSNASKSLERFPSMQLLRKRTSEFVKCRFRPQYVSCLARQIRQAGRVSSFSVVRSHPVNLCVS
eukprot:2211034-Pleurochrysis_carterae.AAC.1